MGGAILAHGIQGCIRKLAEQKPERAEQLAVFFSWILPLLLLETVPNFPSVLEV